MRLLLTAAVVFVLALPATANDCLRVHVEHDEHGPFVVETEGWPETSFPGRQGSDLWFQFDGEPFAVDVSDPTITSVEACPDGSVDVRTDTEPSDPTIPDWNGGLMKDLVGFIEDLVGILLSVF